MPLNSYYLKRDQMDQKNFYCLESFFRISLYIFYILYTNLEKAVLYSWSINKLMIAIVSREVAITYNRQQESFPDPRRESPFKFRRECMKAEINGNGKCGAERDRERLFWEAACFMLKKNIPKAGVSLVIFPLWWLCYELPSGSAERLKSHLADHCGLGIWQGVYYPP